MRNINRFTNKTNKVLVVLSILSLFISGCGNTELEDVVDNPQEYATVYLRQALDGTVSHVFPVEDRENEILLNANYGGIDYPASDITVSLKVMPELADEYNASNGTSYPVLPPDVYRLEQTSTVIPKGKLYSSPVKLKVNTINMPGIAPHLLPVGITEVSNGIKQNEDLRVVYLLIGGKFLTNPYPLFDRNNWTITASSVNGSNAASRLLDDDVTSYWSSSLSAQRPHEVVVDLGETELIHGCIISARRTTNNPDLARDSGNPVEIEIQTSKDNQTWDYSETFSLSYKSESSDGALDKPEETVYLGYGQTARYVKVRIHASIGVNYTWFSELNLF